MYGDVRYSHDDDDPHAVLLKGNNIEDQRLDIGNGKLSTPPSYFGQSEALSYQMKRVESKIQQLNTLHKRHLDRPTLDDSNEEESQIHSLTKDIGDVCWIIISSVQNKSSM